MYFIVCLIAVINHAVYIIMKNILFGFVLMGSVFAAKAQTPSVTLYNMTTATLATRIVANGVPAPTCFYDGETGLFAILPTGTTVNAAAIPMMAWSRPPVLLPATSLVECRFDIDMGGGIHYGSNPASLCTGNAYGVPVSFGGGVFTCLMDIVNAGSNYIITLY